jgi:hypothetical protein
MPPGGTAPATSGYPFSSANPVIADCRGSSRALKLVSTSEVIPEHWPSRRSRGATRLAAMQNEVPLLLLCGAPGSGKSSVAWEVYWSLMRGGIAVAHVDLDGIGYGPPGPSGSFDLKFENVGAVWRNYSNAGASAFVVSGIRALPEDVLACAASVPGSVSTVVVLTVTAEEQRERILGRTNTEYAVERGGGSSAQTPEALEQVVAAARQELEDEAGDIPDAVVLDTVGVPVVEIARQLLLATGWPGSLRGV